MKIVIKLALSHFEGFELLIREQEILLWLEDLDDHKIMVTSLDFAFSYLKIIQSL